MDPFAKPKTSKSRTGQTGSNPFARALAETERSFSDSNKPKNISNPFSEALARTGGKFDNSSLPKDGQPNSPQNLEKQRQELEAKQKKEALRKKLHDQINPVHTKDVFDSKEKRVKEELEKTRQELKLLAREIAALRTDVDIAVTKQVVKPGADGTYYVNFFQQLRSFIILLRQKVKSARTWARQMNTKQAKKKRKLGRGKAGLEIGGTSSEQTKTVFDMMHHERSTAYSGS